MQDRVPTPGKENRVRIRLDDGQTIEGVLEYADEASVQGSVYNKANVLPDDLCSVLELPTSAEPKDAFEHAALPEYSLRIGDIIFTERDMPDNFLPADGRVLLKGAYEQLFNEIGFEYGFGRIIDKTLSIGSGTSGRANPALVVNDDGFFGAIIDKDGYNRYHNVYIGKLTSKEAKVIKTYGQPSNYSTYKSSVAISDEYIYLIQYTSGKYIFRILSFDGVEVAKDENGDLGNSFEHINLLWAKDTLYIFRYSSSSYTDVLKLNSKNSIGYSSVKTVSSTMPVTYSSYGVCNGHVFLDDVRDNGTYTIGGVNSKNKIRGIQQNRDGSLYIMVYKNSTYEVYKTTNGTSFVKLVTANQDLYKVFWYADDEGLHAFNQDAQYELWFRLDGTVIKASLPYTVQYIDSDYPNPMYIKSYEGFLIPYGTGNAVSLMLVSNTPMFQLPDLSSLTPVPYIKAERGDTT